MAVIPGLGDAEVGGVPQIQGQLGLPEALPPKTSKQTNKNKNKK